MPKFIIERNIGKLTDAQLEAGFKQAMKVAEGIPQIKWVRTYYSADEGKMYCEYEAPNSELIFEHARMAKIPADSVRMVEEMLPAMFQ